MRIWNWQKEEKKKKAFLSPIQWPNDDISLIAVDENGTMLATILYFKGGKIIVPSYTDKLLKNYNYDLGDELVFDGEGRVVVEQR